MYLSNADELTIASLSKDIADVEVLIGDINFEEEIHRFGWPLQVKRWLWRDKYYKGLAAYCRLFAPQTALELGTCTGASAVCLAKHAGSVVTCDVTDWSVADRSIFEDNITFFKCEIATDVLTLDYTQFGLLFVDLDHRGLIERLVHHKLVDDGFCGDVFYDDISANHEMKAFWSSVEEPKLDLDWHGSGFGVVRYGRLSGSAPIESTKERRKEL